MPSELHLETTIRLVNGSYHVETGLAAGDPQALSPAARANLAEFGEWLVNAGDETFTSGAATIALPSDPRRFPSQFPVKKIFAVADLGAAPAAAIAALYRTFIEAAIVDAKDTALNLTPSAGRWVSTV